MHGYRPQGKRHPSAPQDSHPTEPGGCLSQRRGSRVTLSAETNGAQERMLGCTWTGAGKPFAPRVRSWGESDAQKPPNTTCMCALGSHCSTQSSEQAVAERHCVKRKEAELLGARNLCCQTGGGWTGRLSFHPSWEQLLLNPLSLFLGSTPASVPMSQLIWGSGSVDHTPSHRSAVSVRSRVES